MARILGLNIPDDKRIEYALTIVYGIGWGNVNKILSASQVDPSKRVKDITEEELKRILQFVDENIVVEGDLRQAIGKNIKRLREIGSFRGGRHAKALPARGQRTKSNARTKRGKRKTVGALKKEDVAKMQTAAQKK